MHFQNRDPHKSPCLSLGKCLVSHIKQDTRAKNREDQRYQQSYSTTPEHITTSISVAPALNFN